MPRNHIAGNKPVNFETYRDLAVQYVSTEGSSKVDKFKKFLAAKCDFDYKAEQFTVEFSSNQALKNVTFKPKSIKVLYRKQSIAKMSYNQKDYGLSNVFRVSVSFSKHHIDFFGFGTDRIFTVLFETNSANGTSVTSTFNIVLPVIKQCEPHFKPPGTRFPDEVTRAICRQNFTMNGGNTKSEIEKVICLEEFKLLSKVERYDVYGYVKMLEMFLDVENSFELDLVQKFNLINQRIIKVNATTFKIETPGQIPNAAASVSLIPMDALFLINDPQELNKLKIRAPITSYHRNFIIITLKRNQKKLENNELYHVEFCPNFYSNAMAQRSLRRITKNKFEDFLVHFTPNYLPIKSNFRFQQFNDIEWLNRDVGSNFAQTQAIKHIVNRTSFPSPYIVFGPPGTGKTSTLVEAVAQIVKLQPTSKVLVTVNSNSACDEIGERLMKFVGLNKMFRFYSPSFAKKMDRVNNKLKACSNLKYNYHIQPSMQELMSYNVIICTLVNSGRLKSLGSSHFDYIIIDECASSAEPYVNIPMTLAMGHRNKFKASVVLLGDPKQLGQIMRTYHSERYGFNISMMERVMEMQQYKFKNDGYDPKFIVQLTDNFRSHHSILSFSNKNFYNSILNAKQDAKIANFAIDWNLLPNPKFPVIFNSSWTSSENDGTSLYNSGDINFIKKYVGSLLKNGINGKKVSAKDIGIISPYAAQRERLKVIYTNGVEIGTVEYFQGREKLVIILSTVRSKTATVGFLKNEKRLNVALTRAKALLIVIGNPETLGKNVFWRKFIAMCVDKKACVGKVPSWVWRKGSIVPDTEEDEDDEVRLEEMMNGLDLDD